MNRPSLQFLCANMLFMTLSLSSIDLSAIGIANYTIGMSDAKAWRNSADSGLEILREDEKRLALCSANLNPFEESNKYRVKTTSKSRRAVQLGEIHEVTSKITNREFELIINYPYSYQQDTTKRYPVVYFTDGFYDFPLLAMIYGEQIYDKTIAECFLVGFSYKGENIDYSSLRMYDYTPTESAQHGFGGGAPEFLKVVEKEFIPYIESNFRIDSSWRALGGSSAGGLFALYAMFAKPQLFDAIIAISPYVAWDNKWLFSFEDEYNQNTKTLPLSLFLTGAEKELPEDPEFLESIRRFDQVLSGRNYMDFRYKYRLLDDAYHSGSKPEGFARGMLFIFEPLLKKADFNVQNPRNVNPIVCEGIVEAPIDSVWSAWATSEGLCSWLAPHAKIDLRVGGLMRTNYHAAGKLGDSGTIENTILSFEPKRMLSIKVSKTPAGFPFPVAIGHMWTVIYFKQLDYCRTHVRIVGLGFQTDEESQKMRTFFDRGNAATLLELQHRFSPTSK